MMAGDFMRNRLWQLGLRIKSPERLFVICPSCASMGRMWTLDFGERQALLQRFLRYVAVDTQSDENATSSPSTEKQKNLGRLLLDELRALGCVDAVMAPTGHVTASLPANLSEGHPAKDRVAAVGFLAHLDTYHSTPGANVKPVVVPCYSGGDLVL